MPEFLLDKAVDHNGPHTSEEKEAPKKDSKIPVEGLQRYVTENADIIIRQFQVKIHFTIIEIA